MNSAESTALNIAPQIEYDLRGSVNYIIAWLQLIMSQQLEIVFLSLRFVMVTLTIASPIFNLVVSARCCVAVPNETSQGVNFLRPSSRSSHNQSKTSLTRWPVIERATSTARDSRVYWSVIVKALNRLPSYKLSETKSYILHGEAIDISAYSQTCACLF